MKLRIPTIEELHGPVIWIADHPTNPTKERAYRVSDGKLLPFVRFKKDAA